MRIRWIGTSRAVTALGAILMAFANPTFSADSRAENDIIFQDRLEAEIVQVPGRVAERIVAARELSSSANSIAALGTQAVFTLGQRSNREIWFADGTDEGSYAIELPEGYEDVTVQGHVVRGDRIYFFASPGSGVTDIWATDGTEPGTEQVVDGTALGLDQPLRELTRFGDSIAFQTFQDGARRVFLLDESALGGASVVEDLRVNGNTSRALAALGQTLYVSGSLNGVDGLVRLTSAGATSQAWEMEQDGPGDRSLPQSMTVSGNSVYFSASQGEGVALWRHTVGGGTLRLFNPREEAEYMRGASNLVAVSGGLYFFTFPWNPDSAAFVTRERLAFTGGTASGTDWYWPPLDQQGILNGANVEVAALGQRMLFRAEITNGTAPGTREKITTASRIFDRITPYRALTASG